MKKIVIFILIIFTLSLFACENKALTYEEEYAQAVKANERAYKRYTNKKNKFYEGNPGEKMDIYYGEYDGAYIIDTNNNAGHSAEVKIKLGKYSFLFWQQSFVPLVVYKNRYYDLEEAYEKGYLSDENVKDFYEVYLKQEELFDQSLYCYLDAINVFYNKMIKGIDGSSYKDVEMVDIMHTKNLYNGVKVQVVARFKSSFLENKRIDLVEKVGPFEFKYEYTNDIIYVIHNNVLYTLKEACENIKSFDVNLPAIYGYYLDGDINKLSYDSLREYFYEYNKGYNISLEEVEITNIIGLYQSNFGAVIVAQIQPGIGYNLNEEKVYESYGYKFVFENDYYDLEVIDLYNNQIVKMDKAILKILKQDALEDIASKTNN